MNSRTLTFRNPKSDDGTVLRTAAQITPGGAPAQMWADVANDSSYRMFHRAVAAYELFKRHLERPSTLEQTASLLAGGRWLHDAVIEKVETMGGEVPVEVPADGAAFVIRFPKDPAAPHPEVGFYLAVDRNLEAMPLRDALMSRTNDPSLGQIHIVDFALFPVSLTPTSND